MNVDLVQHWVNKATCDLRSAAITKVELAKNQWAKDEVRLTLQFVDDGEIALTSLFGDNRNALIIAYGKETDAWIGKHIRLSVQDHLGKKYLKIVPLLSVR